MKQLYKELIVKLDHTLKNLEKRKSFNRDHIFYDILELIKSKVSASERLKIIYTFSEIEKALTLLKSKNGNVEFQISKVDNIYLNLNDNLKHYLSLSYYPMKALQYFDMKEYNKAIAYLNFFFDNAKTILGENAMLLNLASGEQYLNLFRIFYDSEKEDETITTALNLMLLCHYKILTNNDKWCTESKFVELSEYDESEYLFWKIYHTDSIFKKFITKENDVQLKKTVQKMTSKISQKNDNFFYYSLKSLDLFFNENYIDTIKNFMNSLDHFDERSDSLFYLNIVKVNNALSKLHLNNQDFIMICNSYISDKLIKINNQQKVQFLS